MLTPEELDLAGDPERARREVVALARTRFGRPLPVGTTGPSEMLLGVPVPEAARPASPGPEAPSSPSSA